MQEKEGPKKVAGEGDNGWRKAPVQYLETRPAKWGSVERTGVRKGLRPPVTGADVKREKSEEEMVLGWLCHSQGLPASSRKNDWGPFLAARKYKLGRNKKRSSEGGFWIE